MGAVARGGLRRGPGPEAEQRGAGGPEGRRGGRGRGSAAWRRPIDFPGLANRAGPWSEVERIILCTAWCLFNGGDADALIDLLDGELLAEAVRTLDTRTLRLPLEVARLRTRDVPEP